MKKRSKLYELKVSIKLENGYEESNIIAIGSKSKLKVMIILIKATNKKLLKTDPLYKNAVVIYEIIEMKNNEIRNDLPVIENE